LFGAHFKLPDSLRRAIGVNLRWFVPVVGTFSFFLALTYNMADENITEGFSVFVFLLTVLSVIIFAARILWGKGTDFSNLVHKDSALSRFRGPIALLIIGFPVRSAERSS